MSSIRISLVQIDPILGDQAANAQEIIKRVEEAKSAGANLVVFPRLALSGYPPGDLILRDHFLRAEEEAIERIARRTQGITLILGAFGPGRARGEKPSSRALAIRDGEVIAEVGKELLSSSPYFDEKRYLAPGGGDRLIGLAGYRFGLTLGDELEEDESLATELREVGADAVLILAAEPFEYGLPTKREAELREQARRSGLPLIFVNLVGAQDELVFYGESSIILPTGEFLARTDRFVEETITIDLDLRDPATSQPLPTPPRDELGEIYGALTTGLRGYLRKNGFDHVVFGLSGGLDSAMIATIATDALGPEAVTGVWMPSPYSTELSRRDADLLAERLGIELLTIPIDEPFQTFLDLLGPYFEGHEPDLTEENLQARIRGTILMALSNKFGWLVLITSNKSEVAVGYTTLYGDMAGGLAPLKDIPKSLLFELARWRNRAAEVIPTSTIERPPTAELREDQLDTDSLPPYEVLDPILRLRLEEGLSAAEIIAKGYDRETVLRILRLIDRGEYKRRQSAPGIKLSRYTFGVDDTLPMTSGYDEGTD